MLFRQSSNLLLLILGYGLGIVLAFHESLFFIQGVSQHLLVCAGLLLLMHYSKKSATAFWVFSFSMAFFLGSFRMHIHPSQKIHALKNTIQQHFSKGPHLVNFTITEALKSNGTQYKYVAKISPYTLKDSLRSAPKTLDFPSFKVLLSHKKDSLTAPFLPGHKGVAKGYLDPPAAPLLAGGFNYRHYLRTQGIHFTFFATQWTLTTSQNSESFFDRLRIKAQKSRAFLLEKIKKSPLTTHSFQVYSALVFGEKNDLDPRLLNAYQNAGAVHLLAISGLHIGMITALLLFLFAPLNAVPKGRLISSVLLLISLWGYALFSGSSPSVIRAVSMCSFLALAWILKRPMFSFHYLAISMLCMLFWNPLLIFSLGFCMSYAAVASILLGMPLLERLGVPQNSILKRIWQLISISLLAQLGVLGISLQAFHQFPLLFLLTNLLIIPFIGILLAYGIFLALWFALGNPHLWAVAILDQAFKLLNSSVAWVGGQEEWVLKNIYFPSSYLWGTVIVSIGFLSWQYRDPLTIKSRNYFLASLVIVQLIVLGQKSHDKQRNESFLIKSYGQIALLSVQHQEAFYFAADPLPKKITNEIIARYGLKQIHYGKLRNNYSLGKFRIAFPQEKAQHLGGISHMVIKGHTRLYPSDFNPEQLSNTRVIFSGFYPTKEMNTWEKWAQKNGRQIWKIDSQGFYDFKRDISP